MREHLGSLLLRVFSSGVCSRYTSSRFICAAGNQTPSKITVIVYYEDDWEDDRFLLVSVAATKRDELVKLEGRWL